MKYMYTSLLTLLGLVFSSLLFAQDVSLPDATRVELPNGTVLIMIEKHDVPMIGVQAILRGGATADPSGKGGLASLYASLIEKGAGDRDAAEFSAAIDSVGASLSARAGMEGITIGGDFLSRDAGLMVELLADMLQRPALDKDEFEKLRERSINFLRAAKDADPGDLLPTYAAAFVFGEHPYGNPVSGSETSLQALSHDDLQTYFERQVGADRLIIAVAGDFETGAMQAMLKDAFAGWRRAVERPVAVAALPRQAGNRVLLVDKPGATQSYFWIGNVGVARNFKRRADLDIANTVFGGRFTSMLNTALRVESGLTYGARSTLVRPSQPGSIAISSFTRTDATVEAIDMALGVLAQLRDGGIGDEMRTSAQNYVLGQFPTSLETASQLAAQFALLDNYGLGTEYVDGYGSAVRAVSSESLKAIIEEVYPSPEELVFVLIGDAETIRDEVKKYGSVTELSITEPRFRVLPKEE